MQHNTATSRVKLLWRQCVVLGLGLARDELFLHDAARSYELIKKIAWERDTGRIDWLIRHCGRMSACPACLQAAWTNPISHRCRQRWEPKAVCAYCLTTGAVLADGESTRACRNDVVAR